MKFALSSHVLMAHWVPGFLVVMAVRALLLSCCPQVLKGLMDNSGEAITILSVVVVGFFVGEVLDAVRDLLEHGWDKIQPVNWDFLVKGGKDEIENFKAAYFTYYAFDCNATLALLIMSVLAFLTPTPSWARVVLGVFLAIFLVNAILLRKEMAPLTRPEKQKAG